MPNSNPMQEVTSSVSTIGPVISAAQPLLVPISTRRFWGFVAVCLALQFLLAVDCARQWTPTHDEYWHLPIGLRMWKTGQFEDDVINPPPVRLWAALPLFLGGANAGDVDQRLDVGAIGDSFWNANAEHARFWFLLGRLMIIPMMTVTGVVVVLWSRSWYGDRAALVSVLLWTCCPTILANASIVTHDLPLAAIWTLTLWALVRFAQRPTWSRACQFGMALGMAPLIKLTGIILVPLSISLWLVLRIGLSRPQSLGIDDKPIPVPRSRLLGQWVVALLVSLLVINAGYLFRGSGRALGSLTLASSQLRSIQQAIPSLPTPAPRDFVAALDRLAQDLERKHPVYLDGEWRDTPFPFYYLSALKYKLPSSTLALLLAGLVAVARPRAGSRDCRHGLFLLFGALLLPILASGSSNQIGIRYVLPTIPLLCIFAGQSARWLEAWSRRTPMSWRSRLIWLTLCLAPLSLRFHPHHLAYFNLLAGGPAGGRWHLVDSNLDWGQDLHALKQYLDQNHVPDVGLAYFGTVSAVKIGIKSHLPPSRFPQPGWYAISANYVQGRPHALRDTNGERVQVGIDEFGYFRFFEPVATIGYSINVYRLTQRDCERYAAAWREMQGSPP
ncbi:MAG: glycosyltransferase family 39 protein [Planctomycetes bacterium]|nr:glycosyltransferase family 39 protein [Planctomycetota bacterium]